MKKHRRSPWAALGLIMVFCALVLTRVARSFDVIEKNGSVIVIVLLVGLVLFSWGIYFQRKS